MTPDTVTLLEVPDKSPNDVGRGDLDAESQRHFQLAAGCRPIRMPPLNRYALGDPVLLDSTITDFRSDGATPGDCRQAVNSGFDN